MEKLAGVCKQCNEYTDDLCLGCKRCTPCHGNGEEGNSAKAAAAFFVRMYIDEPLVVVMDALARAAVTMRDAFPANPEAGLDMVDEIFIVLKGFAQEAYDGKIDIFAHDTEEELNDIKEFVNSIKEAAAPADDEMGDSNA